MAKEFEEIELESMDEEESGDQHHHKGGESADRFNPDMRCIICLDDEPPFVRPCNCSTYHAECLQQEIQRCRRSECSVCHASYRGVTITPQRVRADGGAYEGFRGELFTLYRRYLTYTVCFGFLILLPLLFLLPESPHGLFLLVYVVILQFCFLVHAIYRWIYRARTHRPQFRNDRFNQVTINLPLIHTEEDLYTLDTADESDMIGDETGTADDTAYSIDTELTGTDTEFEERGAVGGAPDDVAIAMDAPASHVTVNVFDLGSSDSPGSEGSGLRRRASTFRSDDGSDDVTHL